MGKATSESLVQFPPFLAAVSTQSKTYLSIEQQAEHFRRVARPERGNLIGVLGLLAAPRNQTDRAAYDLRVFYEGAQDAQMSANALISTLHGAGTTVEQNIAQDHTALRLPQWKYGPRGVGTPQMRLVGGIAVFASDAGERSQLFINDAARLDVANSFHRAHRLSHEAEKYLYQACTKRDIGRQAAIDITALAVLGELAAQNDVESGTALMLQ